MAMYVVCGSSLKKVLQDFEFWVGSTDIVHGVNRFSIAISNKTFYAEMDSRQDIFIYPNKSIYFPISILDLSNRSRELALRKRIEAFQAQEKKRIEEAQTAEKAE